MNGLSGAESVLIQCVFCNENLLFLVIKEVSSCSERGKMMENRQVLTYYILIIKQTSSTISFTLFIWHTFYNSLVSFTASPSTSVIRTC